ncbi:MAG: YdcF family protein [Aquificae bacterium]|nr:YdcF family protein [Aquificota bacterium]
MFYFSKFIASWILPPGALILFLLLIVFFLKKGRAKKGLFLALSMAIFIYLISIEPVKNILLKPLETEFPFPENIKELSCDAIVILGGGIVRGSPDSFGKASPSNITLKRLFMGYRVWKEIKKPIIVSGGLVYYKNGETEADVMKKTLVSIGVPSKMIFKEGGSRNTYENVQAIRELLDEKEYKLVCLVTSAYHMPRAVYVFQSFYISVEPVPTDYRIDKKPLGWYSFIPNYKYFYESTLALKEYIGIFYYTFRYGI